MNPIQAVSSDDQNVVELSESPGRRLRVLRQSKGWEIERVASQLHLRPHLVEAIEQDRFHELPGPVFVMGYLRNYARLLGIDPEPLIGAYRAANPEPESRAPWVNRSSAPKPEIGSGHILVRLVSLGLILAVIGMLVLWWQNRPEPLPEPSLGLESPDLPLAETEELVAEGLTLEDPEAVEPLPEPPDGEAGSAALALPAPQGAGNAPDPTLSTVTQPPQQSAAPSAAFAEPGTEPAMPAAAADAAPESPPAQPRVPEVVLTFSGTSWIDVRDAAGKVILTGEMRKGDRRVLTGADTPYSFVIGNAKAAALTVGGKSLDLSTRSRSGVARFKLDPSNPE